MLFFDPLIQFLIVDENELQLGKTAVNYLRGYKDNSRVCCRKCRIPYCSSETRLNNTAQPYSNKSVKGEMTLKLWFKFIPIINKIWNDETKLI
jgi:hypothetical protein